ncbi:ketol-acid reductoisomerase [Candidatus Woesearchaeota archaeon CG1_02_57_44]|nr:MAG: ketol-acid reductoisomerase [Candidatus Woesearchaeota archaeon CG1_02_57_44]
MAELLQDEDVTSSLSGKKLAVIGYASQGRGQSLCYRDSGVDVIVGLRKGGASWARALEDGWAPGTTLMEIPDAVKAADIVLLLIADTAQPEVYAKSIAPSLSAGKMLVFSHGFNIHFKGIAAPKDVDVAMIAPKGPGFVVRQEYEKGFGVPALVAVHQDASGSAWDLILAMAKAIGATKPGVLKTTFKDEVESDLFGEQVDLCGGVVEMVKHAYETLIEAGYNPALAYWEVHHELYGLIAPLAYQYGNYGMLSRVSLTARKGAVVSGPRVMTADVKERMKECLVDIQSGKFAKDWMAEYKEHGYAKLNAELDMLKAHQLEVVGKQVRRIMWPKKDVE